MYELYGDMARVTPDRTLWSRRSRRVSQLWRFKPGHKKLGGRKKGTLSLISRAGFVV